MTDTTTEESEPKHPNLLLEKEMRESYLNYSMSVILSRALPDARDGLKPSQRRILVAMHDLTLAVSVADECWLVDHGRLVAAGPSNEVISVEQLHMVFGVGFEWIERPGGGRILLPKNT